MVGEKASMNAGKQINFSKNEQTKNKTTTALPPLSFVVFFRVVGGIHNAGGVGVGRRRAVNFSVNGGVWYPNKIDTPISLILGISRKSIRLVVKVVGHDLHAYCFISWPSKGARAKKRPTMTTTMQSDVSVRVRTPRLLLAFSCAKPIVDKGLIDVDPRTNV